MKTKYNNVKTLYKGKTYDSKKESLYAAYLAKAKEVTKVEEQVKLYIIPPNTRGIRPLSYVCDFRVTYRDGNVEYIDVKGFRTEVYKMKKKLVKYFLDIDITEI